MDELLLALRNFLMLRISREPLWVISKLLENERLQKILDQLDPDNRGGKCKTCSDAVLVFERGNETLDQLMADIALSRR